MAVASRRGWATQERSWRDPNTVSVWSSSHSSEPCSPPVSLLCRISSCLQSACQWSDASQMAPPSSFQSTISSHRLLASSRLDAQGALILHNLASLDWQRQ